MACRAFRVCTHTLCARLAGIRTVRLSDAVTVLEPCALPALAEADMSACAQIGDAGVAAR